MQNWPARGSLPGSRRVSRIAARLRRDYGLHAPSLIDAEAYEFLLPKGNCSIEDQAFVGPEYDKGLREVETGLGRTTGRTKEPEYAQRQRAAARRRATEQQ